MGPKLCWEWGVIFYINLGPWFWNVFTKQLWVDNPKRLSRFERAS